MIIKDFKYRFFYALLRTLAMLPLSALYALMWPLRVVLEYVVGYRKKIIRKNLHNSFPEKSDRELKIIERGFYRHLCDVIVETVKLAHISNLQLAERMTVSNPDLVNKYLKEGTPVVLMLGHIGNWEWVPQLSVSADPKVKFGEIYRRTHDKVWGRIIHTIRDRWQGVVQISQEEAVRTILRWNKKGAWMTGFIADQRPNSSNLRHWMTFLNQETAVTVGAETIGKYTGARFVYIDITKKRRGYYSIRFQDIVPDSDSKSEFPVTEKYLRLLEATIKRDPALWLWSHNRWKYSHLSHDS